MITEDEYKAASKAREEADKIMQQYHKEEVERFEKRMKENPVFLEDELRFSSKTLCPCGYGLAYPKKCGLNHYWDCSAILMGKADPTVTHTDRLPFAFYNVQGESEHNGTTRGVFKPKEPK